MSNFASPGGTRADEVWNEALCKQGNTDKASLPHMRVSMHKKYEQTGAADEVPHLAVVIMIVFE